MSNKFNTEWLESAKEWFEEAVSTENWTLCRAIIDDVRDINPGSATVLERELFRVQNIPYSELGDDGMIRTI